MRSLLRLVAAAWRDRACLSILCWVMMTVVVMVIAAAGVAALDGAARSYASQVEANPADEAETMVDVDAAHPLDPLIADVARKHMPPHWDWRLLKAMVRQESGYDPAARSPGGAVGLAQMQPSTARHMGLTSGQFFKARPNLEAGTRYLRRIYDDFATLPDEPPHWLRTRMAIAGYNAGPGRARQALAAASDDDWTDISEHLPGSTRHHVERIVDEFYPSFAAVTTQERRPAIGGWKPRLRFWSPAAEPVQQEGQRFRTWQPQLWSDGQR